MFSPPPMISVSPEAKFKRLATFLHSSDVLALLRTIRPARIFSVSLFSSRCSCTFWRCCMKVSVGIIVPLELRSSMSRRPTCSRISVQVLTLQRQFTLTEQLVPPLFLPLLQLLLLLL